MESTLTCPCCKQMFDLDVKEPGQLTCCGETVCRECFNGKFKQGNVAKCLLCDDPTEKCEHVISRFARTLVKKALAPKVMKITCDIHEKIAEYYIKRLNKIVCSDCFNNLPDVIIGDAFKFENLRLFSYIKDALQIMQSHSSKVTTIINTCQSIDKNEQVITTSSFMTLANEIQTIFDITGVEEEKKDNEHPYLLSFLTHDPQDRGKQNRAQYSQQGFKCQLNEASKINEVNSNIDLFRLWIGNKNMNLQLEFRATRDGFTIQPMRERLLGKGPLVVFISTEFGRVFGAFWSIPWARSGWFADPTAFIFSLTNKSKHEQCLNDKNALNYYAHGDIILSFGGGDIHISKDCNKNRESLANLGNSYKALPGVIKYDTEKGQKYLGGKENFKVTEIEVYTVTFY